MIDSEQEKRLRELVNVFLAENEHINLSALRTEDACWTGNVLDSLPMLELPSSYQIPDAFKLLDLGTGGGFPLLPLAMMRPEASFTGLDSTSKKLEAIGRIMRAMNIPNVQLLSGRAEELAHDKKHREQYDYVTARAVAPLPTLIEFMAPFTKVNGYCIAWKSLHIEQEMQDSLAARSALDCHLVYTHQYTLPGDWGTRQLLVFQKMKPTQARFPRAVGIPKKEPIA